MKELKKTCNIKYSKMRNYMSKNGYVVRKEELSEEQILSLRHELRGRPIQDEKYNLFNNKDTSFPIYIETKNKFYIPKMYGYKNFGNPHSMTQTYIGKDINERISFTGNLLEHQQKPCDILLSTLKKEYGGILSLGTGFGKTVSALYVASKLGKKTLIIVNKISLLNQWKHEIKTFLPDADVGVIQGSKNVDVEDKDFVIGMLQSLAKIDYPQSLFDDYGTVIVDEIHNLSSPVFSKVLMKICALYTIGLSATPKRSDGCEYVFKWFIGDIVYQSKSKREGLPPCINYINISSKDYKEIVTINKMTGMNQIMFSSMISELIRMEKRNEFIIDMIKQLLAINVKRKILLLSDRREHLLNLKNILDKDQDVNFTYGLFLGQMKITELEKSKACQLILATYQAFGEGVNEKELNTIILATPKKFIGHLKNTKKNESGKLEQIIGRIFRKEHTTLNPLIIDFNDNFSIYKAQSRQRCAFYKQHFTNAVYKKSNVDIDDLQHLNYNELFQFNGNLFDSEQNNSPTMDTRLYTTCLLDD